MPDFLIETSLLPRRVCGVDEAGRGPWAGPVVAASVIFRDAGVIPDGLNDSKKLTAKTREALAAQLWARPQDIFIGVGIATAEEIDVLNIWGATSLAMRRAAEALKEAPEIALIDGNLVPHNFPYPVKTIVGGDGISLSIAAASIIAKTTRDRMMAEYALKYPHYGFERHAGYGTAAHQQALAAHGPCPIHRRSYKPIRAYLHEAA
jgi:ribonuclease HII